MGGIAMAWGRRVAGLAWIVLWGHGCELGSVLDDFGVPVAWVGNQPVVREDLQVSGPLETQDQRREAIERGVDELLAANEARRRGLGFTEDAVRRIAAVRRAAKIRERKILRDALFDVVASEIELSEAELRKDFELRHELIRRRHVTLRMLGFPTPEAAQRADAALGPEGRLDPTTSSLLGPLLVRKLSPELRDAARQVRSTGERVVADLGDQWSIVELVDEQVGEPLSFEDAREAVDRNLRRRRARERFESELELLRGRVEIRLAPKVLENDQLWLPQALAPH